MFREYSDIIRKTASAENIEIPAYDNRGKWNDISADCLEFIIDSGEKYLGYKWPSPPASLYLEYTRNGNRNHYEGLIFNERRLPLLYLIAAECFEGKGRFVDDIINGLWSTLDEATWVAPAHNGGNPLPDFEKEQIIDLFSAECSAILSCALFSLGDTLDTVAPQITSRMRLALDSRIFTPFLENEYWWTGLMNNRIPNNWNPWIISNILTSVFLAPPESRKTAAVIDKCLLCLDIFLKYYAQDGGCDEGPCYWTVACGCLFDSIDLLYDVTGGKVNLFTNELVSNMCSYICKMHIDGKYYVCYADADAKTNMDAHLIYRMGQKTGNGSLVEMASAIYHEAKKDGRIYNLNGCEAHIYRSIKKFFCDKELSATDYAYPYPGDAWFDGIQVMTSRMKSGSAEGIFLSAKGGNNGESHNHNDIGTFVIYSDGLPAVIDIGRGEYVKKTFSPYRYEILQMQSGYHNLPIIGGITQKQGIEYKALDTEYKKTGNGASMQLNLKNAYPEETGIKNWIRSFRLDRDDETVRVSDSFSLNKPEKISFVFMTSVEPVFNGSKMILNINGITALSMSFDDSLIPTVERFDTASDPGLADDWGECVYRVILNTPDKRDKGEYHFLFSKAE